VTSASCARLKAGREKLFIHPKLLDAPHGETTRCPSTRHEHDIRSREVNLRSLDITEEKRRSCCGCSRSATEGQSDFDRLKIASARS